MALLILRTSAGYGIPLATTAVDLRSEGSSGTANGGLFYQNVSQPTGTGVYDPFLRLQDTPIEEGFNTDYRLNGQAPLDDKSDPNFTHSMTLGSLASSNVNGVDYYAFSLDIDEPNSGPKRYVSLDQVKIYVAGSPTLSELSSATLKWDMDGAGDVAILMDGGALSPGNGGDDMQMLVPTSFFAGVDPSQYVYFYSMFGATKGYDADPGTQWGSKGSFEEWRSLSSAQSPTPAPVPEPATALLLAVGLAGLSRLRRYKRS